jgi:hypothetical protein
MKLVESITATESRLDRKRGIVRDVKILGFYSEHGYEYSEGAMQRAISLYEGVAVNVDHPARNRAAQSRSYADRFGRLKNVRFIEGRGLVGDLHYNRQHPIAAQFEYDVEHSPENLGLSHNASGRSVREGNRTVVDSIVTVRSVDLVADPATNVSLFESRNTRRRAAHRTMSDFLDDLMGDSDDEFVEASNPNPDDDWDDEDAPSREKLAQYDLKVDDEDDAWDREEDAHDGEPLENYDLWVDDEEV